MITAYKFNIKGATTENEVSYFIEEVNNCEFCNKGTLDLSLSEFTYLDESEISTVVIRIISSDDIDINNKLTEIVHCEFCHGDISIMPVKIK